MKDTMACAIARLGRAGPAGPAQARDVASWNSVDRD
jgi:hypothetical protein